jgi:uncharacterized repeat protein (TIGR01451 family)
LGVVALNEVVTIIIHVDGPDSLGTFFNTASISSYETDPVPSNNSNTEDTTTLHYSADLIITKSDSPDPVLAGQPLAYTIHLHNDGPFPGYSMVVTDTLPAGVIAHNLPANCYQNGNNIACYLDYLEAGQTATWVINTTAPNNPGVITNTVIVNGGYDPNPTSNFFAEHTTVVGDTPTPSPTPSHTPTPTPTPTSTQSPTPTPTHVTITPFPTDTPTPTYTPSPTATISPSATPTPIFPPLLNYRLYLPAVIMKQ